MKVTEEKIHYNWFIIGVLTATLWLTVSASYEDYPTECPKVDPMNYTVLLPHETDCEKYYACSNGRKILMLCALMDDKGNRLHFNPTLHVCDYPNHAGCAAHTTTTEETTLPTEITTMTPPSTTIISSAPSTTTTRSPSSTTKKPKTTTTSSPSSTTKKPKTTTTSRPSWTTKKPKTTTEPPASTTESTTASNVVSTSNPPTTTTVSSTTEQPTSSAGTTTNEPSITTTGLPSASTVLSTVNPPTTTVITSTTGQSTSSTDSSTSEPPVTWTTEQISPSTEVSTNEPPSTTTEVSPTTTSPSNSTPDITSSSTSELTTNSESTSSETISSTSSNAIVTTTERIESTITSLSINLLCTQSTTEVYFPHESYLHLYYECNHGELIRRVCDESLVFDVINQVCVWSLDKDYSEELTETPTTIDPSNSLDVMNLCNPDNSKNQCQRYPHECECNKFYVCINSNAVLRICPSRLNFNPILKECDLPENVECDGGDNGNGNDNNSTTPIPTECPPDNTGWAVHLAHETNCSLFYKCNWGEKVELPCRPGLHFNPKLQVCDWPCAAGCTAEGGDGTNTCHSPSNRGGEMPVDSRPLLRFGIFKNLASVDNYKDENLDD